MDNLYNDALSSSKTQKTQQIQIWSTSDILKTLKFCINVF